MLNESHLSVQLPSGVTVFSEHFHFKRPGKAELRAEIDFLNEMLYIWIGLADKHQFTNLQIAYPGNVRNYLIAIFLNSSSFLLSRK